MGQENNIGYTKKPDGGSEPTMGRNPPKYSWRHPRSACRSRQNNRKNKTTIYRRMADLLEIISEPHIYAYSSTSTPLTKTRIKLHETLAKAESALPIQIRSEKICLADFLFRRRNHVLQTQQ